MTLSSFSFYFLAFFLICSIVPAKKRTWILLIANLIFILSVNSNFGLAFITIALSNYFLTTKSLAGRNHCYQWLILINVLFLVLFKYIFPVLSESSSLHYILPVGISLFVFQQISFIVDRYNQEAVTDISLIDFLTYSFFFIPFATGPLTRIDQLLQQKAEHLHLSEVNFTEGSIWIYFGIFKKFVIADHISRLTNSMFNPTISGIHTELFIPFLLSKYEIFANFSGYTDMAIGMGLILGFRLPLNFNRPFATTSIIEFWKRWHMSLSHWIRDYLFYPLSVSKFGRLGPYAILTVTFLTFAAWHDIKLTFLCYGLIQVVLIYLAHKCSRLFLEFNQSIQSRFLKKTVVITDWLIFYSITLSIPGILFRSSTIEQFVKIMNFVSQSTLIGTLGFINSSGRSLIYTFLGIAAYEVFEYKVGISKFISFFIKKTYFKKTIIFYFLLMLILLFYSKENHSGFIYSVF